MGLDRVALRQVVTVAKNSDRLKKSIKDMKGKVIDKGLEIVQKSGIDINNLPIDGRAALRGEGINLDTSKLLTPEVICAQPLMTLQQKEENNIVELKTNKKYKKKPFRKKKFFKKAK